MYFLGRNRANTKQYTLIIYLTNEIYLFPLNTLEINKIHFYARLIKIRSNPQIINIAAQMCFNILSQSNLIYYSEFIILIFPILVSTTC